MPFDRHVRQFRSITSRLAVISICASIILVVGSCTISDGANDVPLESSISVDEVLTPGQEALHFVATGEQQAFEAWYDSSLVSFRSASQLYLETEDWAGYVVARIGEAAALERLSQFEDGLASATDAVDVARQRVDSPLLAAKAMDAQAENLIRLGRYDEAMATIDEALAIKYEVVDSLSREIGYSLLIKGWVYQEREQFDKSLRYYLSSSDALVRSTDDSKLLLARVQNNLGILSLHVGHLDSAVAYFDDSLDIREYLLPNGHPLIAYSLGNLSHTYSKLGDQYAALDTYLSALDIFTKRFGQKHHDVAISYQNISRIYSTIGDTDLAEHYAKEALAIDSTLLGINHKRYLSSKMSLGRVYARANKHRLAIETLTDSNKKWMQMFGRHSDSIEQLCESLIIESAEESLECFTNVYHQYQDDPYRSAADIADVLSGRAKILVSMNRLSEARSDLETANALSKEEFGINAYRTKSLEHTIAGVDFAIGNFENALVGYDEILATEHSDFMTHQDARTTQLKDVDNLLAQAHLGRANVLSKLSSFSAIEDSSILNEFELAVDASLKSLNHNRRALKKTSTLTGAVVQNLIESNLQWSDALIRDSTIWSFFDIVEASRSLSLRTKIQNTNAKSFGNIPDSLLSFERRLGASIESNAISIQMAEHQSSKALANLHRQQLINSTQSYDSLITIFEEQYPAYYELKHSSKTASISDIQNHLRENEALVEYVVGQDSTYAFSITKGSVDFTTIGLSDSIKHVVNDYRIGLSERDDSLYFVGARRSYDFLVKPLLPQIQDRNLIIIPDDELYFIPFGPMLDERADEQYPMFRYSRLEYLIRDRAVSYAYSATLLLETRRKPKKEPTKRLLAFAPVVTGGFKPGDSLSFGIDPGIPVHPNSAISTGASAEESDALLDSLSSLIQPLVAEHTKPLRNLPASRHEVRRIIRAITRNPIAKLFPLASESYFDVDAGEYLIKQPGVADYRYIHLATHGFLKEDDPDLSSLIFRRDESSDEDGILYLGEVYGLNLNADLVVLSACDTGLGKIAANEGVIGLTRGFLYAGARNVVVSLWLANDVGARDTMVPFYRAVRKGNNFAEALQIAKVEFMDASPIHADPYYWAPFIVIGQ